MSTTTEKLREAAEHFAKYPSCECDPDSGVFNCMGCDIDRMAQYILATVHPDDAEPVTVDKLKAMGAIVVASTIENPDTGFDDLEMCLNDDQDTVDLRVYRESDLSIDVWINNTALAATIRTMGQLRHLLAGLGMGGGK